MSLTEFTRARIADIVRQVDQSEMPAGVGALVRWAARVSTAVDDLLILCDEADLNNEWALEQHRGYISTMDIRGMFEDILRIKAQWEATGGAVTPEPVDQ